MNVVLTLSIQSVAFKRTKAKKSDPSLIDDIKTFSLEYEEWIKHTEWKVQRPSKLFGFYYKECICNQSLAKTILNGLERKHKLSSLVNYQVLA